MLILLVGLFHKNRSPDSQCAAATCTLSVWFARTLGHVRIPGLGEMYASAHNWTQTRARRKQARVENQHHFALLWSILCLFWGFVGGYNAYLLTLLESIRREVIVLSGLIEAGYKCKLKAWWKQGARKWKQARADESNWALACAQEWKQACA